MHTYMFLLIIFTVVMIIVVIIVTRRVLHVYITCCIYIYIYVGDVDICTSVIRHLSALVV